MPTLASLAPAALRTIAGLVALAVAGAAQAQRTRAPEAQAVPDSVMRRVVARHLPGALTGAMGARPFVWILVDGRGEVLRTATGRDGLLRNALGGEWLDWAAAARKLPGMPQSMRPGDLLQLGLLPAGGDTVGVAWVRWQRGTRAR
jgi:hypothetical protein